MNRVVQLVRTDSISLARFDHAPGVPHEDPERERAAQYCVNFVEADSFRVRTTGGWCEIGVDTLFVTRPGLEFSCAHDADHPRDSCLSVSFSDEAAESARAFFTLSDSPVRPLTNRQALLQRALRAGVPEDAARIEALAGTLLSSLSIATARHPLFRPERLAWYAARVDRAKAMMQTHYAEPLSLSTLARDAGMSMFHFARIFGELEGRPPHRFLSDVRLTQAYARLRDGDAVTDTCFAVGFGSLSHFVTMFRRRYGTRPSDIRRSTAQ